MRSDLNGRVKVQVQVRVERLRSDQHARLLQEPCPVVTKVEKIAVNDAFAFRGGGRGSAQCCMLWQVCVDRLYQLLTRGSEGERGFTPKLGARLERMQSDPSTATSAHFPQYQCAVREQASATYYHLLVLPCLAAFLLWLGLLSPARASCLGPRHELEAAVTAAHGCVPALELSS